MFISKFGLFKTQDTIPKETKKELSRLDKQQKAIFKQVVKGNIAKATLDLRMLRVNFNHVRKQAPHNKELSALDEKIRKLEAILEPKKKNAVEYFVKAIYEMEQVKGHSHLKNTLEVLKQNTLDKISTDYAASPNDAIREKKAAELYSEFVKIHQLLTQLKNLLESVDAYPTMEKMGLDKAVESYAAILEKHNTPSEFLEQISVSDYTNSFESLTKVFQSLGLLSKVKVNKANRETLVQLASFITNTTPKTLSKNSTKQLKKLVLDNREELSSKFMHFAIHSSDIVGDILKTGPENRKSLVDLMYATKMASEQLQRMA